MNLLEISTEVRRILAETDLDASYYTPTDIKKFTFEGIKHMCIEGKVYEKSLSLTISDNIGEYYLPHDFIGIKSFRNQKGVPLDALEVDEVGGVYIIPGKPLNYYLLSKSFSPTAWVGGTSYIIFPPACTVALTYIKPTVVNGYLYECVLSGSSGVAEPDWSTEVGAQVSDGGINWKCRELFSSLYTLNLYDTPTLAGGGIGTYKMVYAAVDEGLFTDTDSPNFPSIKHHYLVPYTCYRCALKGKDLTLAMAFLTEYNAGMGFKMELPAGGGVGTEE